MSKIVEGKKNFWFIFHNHQLLLEQDKNLPPEHPIIKENFARSLSLGCFNNVECFCAEVLEASDLPATFEFISLRKAFEKLGKNWYGAIAKAISILLWDANHQFCGKCATPTYHKSGSYERICPACGLVVYPRISPSVIVLIRRGEYLLMARSPHFAPGAYGLIAGFVEAGENLEDAIYREVYEETQLKIKNLTYFDSQSWPFPDSLMIGFIADYASGELVIDKTEIEAADWYRYDQLPGRPSSNISIASRLIDYFVSEQTNKHTEFNNGNKR